MKTADTLTPQLAKPQLARDSCTVEGYTLRIVKLIPSKGIITLSIHLTLTCVTTCYNVWNDPVPTGDIRGISKSYK
jgi:hypothetical protein